MAKYSKAATKKKVTRVPAKESATKKKTGRNKVVTKKAAPKKKVAAKKNTVAKKSTIAKRNTERSKPKRSARSTNGAPVKTISPATATNGATESQLPPVEEKSPVISGMPANNSDMDKKYLQHLLVQNGGNKSIRLTSVKKGGIKPSGKKPLW